ncbi:MAG: hypothetical protein HFF62_04070 [Oscillospiraceae bacterium]|nr:hypothetical protein [Oscillospiraceae bacterium]
MSEPINRDAMTEYIKVNLPLTEQDYANGNGEGVWVLVDPETKKANDEDVAGGLYVGILSNDSCYYPGLNCGELLPFEMRGEHRPVADFHGFLSKLTKLTPEGKELLIRQIAEHRAMEPKPPICCDCQFCGDKHSFPEPNDLVEIDPENPLLKHFYCCCGDCELYEKDITGLGIQECEHFEEL